jgi:hypothetical protein
LSPFGRTGLIVNVWGMERPNLEVVFCSLREKLRVERWWHRKIKMAQKQKGKKSSDCCWETYYGDYNRMTVFIGSK